MNMNDVSAAIKELMAAVNTRLDAADKRVKAAEDLARQNAASLSGLEQHVAGGASVGASLAGVGNAALEQSLDESAGLQALRSKNATRCSIRLPADFAVKAAMTSDNTGALTSPMRWPEIVAGPQRRVRIRDLLPMLKIETGSMEYARDAGFTNAAAVVPEGTLKPQSAAAFELKTAKIATIAHWTHAARQLLDDTPQLVQFLSARMRYGLQLVEDGQLLAGDGTGANLLGLLPQATAYSAPVTYTGATRLDVIRLAQGQLENADFEPSGVVLNPNDWMLVELLKDDNKNYLKANPSDANVRRAWGMPVVTSTAMPAGTFMVGDFQRVGVMLDRMEPEVAIATQDGDDFVKNLIKIRVEERVGLAVMQPQALIVGTFA